MDTIRGIIIPLGLLAWSLAVKFTGRIDARGRLGIAVAFAIGHFAYVTIGSPFMLPPTLISAATCGLLTYVFLSYLRRCNGILWWAVVLSTATLAVFVGTFYVYLFLFRAWAPAAAAPTT